MFDLDRFVAAQEPVFMEVLAELMEGRKTSHWMWFVFPQLRGLGHSATADHFGLASLEEARAYRAHPVLGPRLVACCDLLLGHRDRSIRRILGAPDDLKLRSSMTLFKRAAPATPIFDDILHAFYDGEEDEATLALLSAA